MNKIVEFKRRYLENPIEMNSPFKDFCVLKEKRGIYFLYNGLLTEDKKDEVDKFYKDYKQEKIFVSLIPSQNYLVKKLKHFVLDTYIWSADEPEHSVHYSSKPVLKPRRSQV